MPEFSWNFCRIISSRKNCGNRNGKLSGSLKSTRNGIFEALRIPKGCHCRPFPFLENIQLSNVGQCWWILNTQLVSKERHKGNESAKEILLLRVFVPNNFPRPIWLVWSKNEIDLTQLRENKLFGLNYFCERLKIETQRPKKFVWGFEPRETNFLKNTRES